MKSPPAWLFLAIAIPCLVLTCVALAYGSSLKTIVALLGLLGTCAGWYFTLRGEERFESQPHYRDLRNNILSSLPVGSAPQLSRPELPPDLCWSIPREHFGLTKYGFGKFRRTTFWCTAASGHFDQVDDEITAVFISPNFGRWRRNADKARRHVLENPAARKNP